MHCLGLASDHHIEHETSDDAAMTLSFASLRSRSLGREKTSLPKEGPRSETKQKSREDGVADDGDAKLSPPSARGEPHPDNAAAADASAVSDDDLIPFLRAHVAKYATRDNWRGAQVSAVTFVYFVLTALAPWLLTARLSAAASALGLSPAARAVGAALLWAAWGILRAAAYVRSFMLMHDCVHGSLFASRRLNKHLGRLFGVFGWLSSDAYQRKHLVHHMRLGIEEEGPWDADRTAFWTVKEWEAWEPGFSKMAARVARSEALYFLFFGPVFFLHFGSTAPAVGPNLTPFQKLRKLFEANAVRISLIILGTAGIAGISSWARCGAEYGAGFIAMAIGVATFSVTHTFGEGYIKPRAEHSRDAAALSGSSRVRLPRWLADHVFMNITEHHIHHLDARVPCYRLRECHEGVPDEVWARAGVHSLGFKGVREALRLALWDEEKEAHVPFPPLFEGGELLSSWGAVVRRVRSVVAGKAA